VFSIVQLSLCIVGPFLSFRDRSQPSSIWKGILFFDHYGLCQPAYVILCVELPLYPNFQPPGWFSMAGYNPYTNKPTTNTENYISIDMDMVLAKCRHEEKLCVSHISRQQRSYHCY
jgi:hypothetical protein